MHGRPRKPSTAADPAASAAKAAKLSDLQSQLLHNHRNQLYNQEALSASAKLLEINPEVYTAWNYRKLALQHNLREESDRESIKSLVDQELKTVEMALRRNPKSYGAWHHRKWVLSCGFVNVDFDREFRLLDQLLKADPRNFHGWSYHRFVAKLKNVPEVEELKFTMDMINTNFSNYSAWHNRSALLSRLLKLKAEGFDAKEKILTEEYELVRQALFTDPSDQSGWFYHLWLLDQTVTPDDPLLISSWPSHGSDWVLHTDRNFKSCKLFPSSCSDRYYSLHTGTLPIILYFDQAVTGVSSSTITVSNMFAKNEDVIWSPLSTTKSSEAHCWVSYLKISDIRFSNSESHAFEVDVGHSSGITSSSGSPYRNPSQFRFTLNVKSIDLELTEQDSVEELFAWNDDYKELDQESATIISCGKLNITKDHVPETSKWNVETLSNEISLFRELEEENCKFVKLTLARLLVAQDAVMSNETFLKQKRNHSAEIWELWSDLIKLDPSHARYYEDERSLVLMNQATIDEESMMKHCIRFGKQAPISLHHAGLCLGNLSLTRIGSVKHLLWVQMLDLSHNKLRSAAGLEALQLLVCLNLSNNQISSFTSLAPLKLLSSLKVLNISFNEIGCHPVDTTRYLCLSPLSHTADIADILEDLRKDNIKVEDHWEAILLFKELKLTQLDITGNAIVDEAFSSLLTRVLPMLKWLDRNLVR